MVASRADFDKRLSGGAANTDPNLSLGGAMSTEVILNQSVVYSTGSVTGVTLVQAFGHDAAQFAPNTGTLAFTFATTSLTWTPFGGVTGAPVDVSIDGRYVIADSVGDKYITVDVVAASLPGANSNAFVQVDEIQNELFDNVSGAESAVGHIDYRCFYVTNVNVGDDIANIRIWIENQPIGPDDIAIGLDPAGINGVAVTIVDEVTAPVGVVFTTPGDVGSAILIGNLTPADFQGIWVRRNIPVNTLVSQQSDLSRIQFEVGFP